MPNWSTLHFLISSVKNTKTKNESASSRPIYKIKDYLGEKVDGSFLPQRIATDKKKRV